MVSKTVMDYGFHAEDNAIFKDLDWARHKQVTAFTYTFENFFHPFVGRLVEKLNKDSLRGMLDPSYHHSLLDDKFFSTYYADAEDEQVTIDSRPKEIDLSEGGPYANYNWELLFHFPLTIAVHLSKNQRFAEAQRWFHFIFDPTSNDTSVQGAKRFWKFLKFRKEIDITQIDELLKLLSSTDPNEATLKNTILKGYEAIREKPFQPHAVARTRHVAYQYSVIMKYLDNLIAWGDSLFRQDTVESINEATQRYVIAANLLGPRPQIIPQRGGVRPKTFAELKESGLKKSGLDVMGNAMVDLEGRFPFNIILPQPERTDPDAPGQLFGIGRTLYFCVPQNDRLLAYWDTVADRLYKIHNCMNIEGVVRQLALFDPPIDPGMLVKAAAAGIDIGSVLSGLNQPVGQMRCLFLIQKALEISAEVRGLGSALLSAIEKGDAEHMALLRQGHEINIQEMAKEVRFLQWKQSQESTESLQKSRATVLERYKYYQRLLGLTPDTQAVPDALPLDRRDLTEEGFDEAYAALVGQYERAIKNEPYPPIDLKTEGRLKLLVGEYDELNESFISATNLKIAAAGAEGIAAALAAVPNFNIKMAYWGIGGESELTGGAFFSNIGRAVSAGFNISAMIVENKGQNASKTASYERRADEWMLQSNLAARELMQIGRQIIGSLIAEQIARHEYQNVQKQIELSKEVEEFLHDKFTNEELYGWMQGEMSRLYYEYYRFAFDTARRAEKTMKHELMRPEVDAADYVKFNYWDGGRKGLLSGEALYLDIKRMEIAYHENNRREYELTKHVSLRQLDPLALLTLKATGFCEVKLPEWLFDLDGPGHYMRRMKNVSVSIPSVAGPYTSINCTLTLLKSSVRKSPGAEEEYPRGIEDPRFIDYFGVIQSIVTSSGNNDGGMFETSLREDKFLPFEGAGAVSTWRLELPASFRQFDYSTISDVIIHVRYTARDGGSQLKDKAVAYLEEIVETGTDLSILFSLPHDFPDEWHKFVNSDENFEAEVKRDNFPYLAQRRDISILEDEIKVYEIGTDDLKLITPEDLDLVEEDGAFRISLALADDVKVQGAEVFIIFKYSLT